MERKSVTDKGRKENELRKNIIFSYLLRVKEKSGGIGGLTKSM